MGMCMLGQQQKINLEGIKEQITQSDHSQICEQVYSPYSAVSFEAHTAKFQKTTSYDLGFSRQIQLNDDEQQEERYESALKTIEEEKAMESKVKGQANISETTSDLGTNKTSQDNPCFEEHSHLSQFSFQVKLSRSVFTQDDEAILGSVIEQRQRNLIMDTLQSQSLIQLEQILFKNGSSYTGQWINAKRHGTGVHVNSQGTYEGEWAENQMVGHGVFSFANKDKYEGQFLDSMMHGNGKYYDHSGSIYDGEFKLNKKDGYGIEVYDHGEYYEGQWKDGYKHGEGFLQFSDGSYVKGMFQDNSINGVAEYHWAGQKKTYKGEWILNKMEGYGVMEWEDGRRFEGSYLNDKMEGKGTYTFQTGQTFTGIWRNNKKNGKGQYKEENGKVIKGIWYEDRLIQTFLNLSERKRFGISHATH